MNFERLLLKAKEGNADAVLKILEIYKPLLIKNAIVNGRFDEDLYQELVSTLLQCIQRFQIIDYFLQNMLICIGYDSIDAIRKEIDDVQISNEHLYELYRVMDKPYNEQLWKGYSKDTGIFKLTQKREYSEYIDGKMTFYGYLKTL